MNKQDLDRLQAVCDAATPGPWHYGEHNGVLMQTSHITRDVWCIPRSENDRAFITSSREAVPTLIAEVRRLQAIIGENGLQNLIDAEIKAESEMWKRLGEVHRDYGSVSRVYGEYGSPRMQHDGEFQELAKYILHAILKHKCKEVSE